MTEQEDIRRKSHRDLLLVLLILPLGVLCMFVTGQAAIRLAPTWVLNADMSSFLDPNAQFAAGGNQLFIEPLDPGILTLPAWGDLFLTPNALIPTRLIPTATPPPPARTPRPPLVLVTPDDGPTPTLVGPIILPTRPGPILADLVIEKSDNSPTYTPGTPINYTILVKNLGPDDARRFNITDNIPAVITGLTVNCTPADRCGTNTSSGNNISFTGASLSPVSGANQITISISGTVASGATGNLSNTAEIVIPSNARYQDPNLSNNTVTDTDTRLAISNLAITKSDGVNTYTATNPINYTVVVTNNGPSDATNFRIRDNLPSQIASWDWICAIVTKASRCTAFSGSADFIDTVDVQSGGRIEYAVIAYPKADVNTTTSNTARIVIPSGANFTDPDLTNNSSTDINMPEIDLQIMKTAGADIYVPGGTLEYKVTVTNTSTFNLTGVTVTDNMPTLITSWTWSCAPDPGPPGASCTPGPSSANINDTAVNLPAGTSVTYTIMATVSNTATGELSNTATVSPPNGLVDAIPDNNTAVTITGRQVEYVSGPPDGNMSGSPVSGSSVDYILGTPITIDGNTSDYEIVFYERERPGNIIELDQVIISIGDGTNWYVVYYWGDNIVDTNASPPGSNSEPDNFPISTSLLYGSPYQTGILIDADGGIGAPPNGTYQYIRVTAPLGDDDGGCDIDAIGFWP